MQPDAALTPAGVRLTGLIYHSSGGRFSDRELTSAVSEL